MQNNEKYDEKDVTKWWPWNPFALPNIIEITEGQKNSSDVTATYLLFVRPFYQQR